MLHEKEGKEDKLKNLIQSTLSYDKSEMELHIRMAPRNRKLKHSKITEFGYNY